MTKLLRTSLLGLMIGAGPASADVGYYLSAQVAERCAIDRVTISNGKSPTAVVQYDCNAGMVRLTFLDLPGAGLIESVTGNGNDAQIENTSVALTSRRPGKQTTVVHFARGVDAGKLSRISLEVS